MPTDDEIETLIARGAPQPSAETRDRMLIAAFAARADRRRLPPLRWWALAAALAIACDVAYVESDRAPRPTFSTKLATAAQPRDTAALSALIGMSGDDGDLAKAAP